MKYRGQIEKRIIMIMAYGGSSKRLAKQYGWRSVRVAIKNYSKIAHHMNGRYMEQCMAAIIASYGE